MRPWIVLPLVALSACKGPNSPKTFEPAPSVKVTQEDIFFDVEGATFEQVSAWIADHGPMNGSAHRASRSEFRWQYGYGVEFDVSICYVNGATVELAVTRRLPRWERPDAPASEQAKFKKIYDDRVLLEEKRLGLVVALASKFVQKVDTFRSEHSCDEFKPAIEREFKAFGELADEALATFDDS